MRTKKPKEVEDGFGPKTRAKCHAACRQIWHRSPMRRECVKRCSRPGDFYQCEGCESTVPKIHIDHIEQVGPVDAYGYFDRLFCPSHRLQGLCPTCHKAKTKAERATAKGKP